MLQPSPAAPGMPLDEVDTPALVLDLDAFEANLDLMAALAAQDGIKLRPHAKTHKSPVVARLQMIRGTVGQCVQKVGEAEVLAWGGVGDILVSNEIIDPRKLARLAALTSIAQVALCTDSAEGVDRIAAASSAAGVRLTVLVEIDVRSGRCGVAPGPEATALARRIAASPHLTFGGLHAYHGSAQHQRTPDQRRASITAAAAATAAVVEDLRQAGLDCAIVGGAGTGTFALEAASGVYTELQVGSYAFMDADYARNQEAPPFRQALFVLATAISTRPGFAVLDACHKAVAVDSGPPLVFERPGATCVGLSDEHANIALSGDAAPIRLGERVLLVPGHCDPTVDRFDWYVGCRKGRVECLWPFAARWREGARNLTTRRESNRQGETGLSILDGRVALITGAAGGIGRSLVEAFREADARVVACDLSAAGLAEVEAAQREAFDLTDPAACHAALARIEEGIGLPDIVVSNAGGSRADTLDQVDDEVWAREIDANLTSARNVTAPLLPAMRARGGGVFVFIASVNGLAHFGNPAYSAAKAGLIAYSRAIATECGPFGIRSNAVCPGTVRTPAWAQRIERSPAILERIGRLYPLGRIVEPAEVAQAALFLAGPAASAITGVALPVDAGLTAGNLPFIAEIRP